MATDIEMAKEALRRAREHELTDPGMAAAIMKSALRTLAGDRNFVERPADDQMAAPGVYVVNGHLFFRLRDGSVVSCNCVGEPYASQIKDACDTYRIY